MTKLHHAIVARVIRRRRHCDVAFSFIKPSTPTRAAIVREHLAGLFAKKEPKCNCVFCREPLKAIGAPSWRLEMRRR